MYQKAIRRNQESEPRQSQKQVYDTHRNMKYFVLIDFMQTAGEGNELSRLRMPNEIICMIPYVTE